MKHFERVEDLVLDDSFCEWIQSGRTKHNTFWTNWKNENVHRQSLVEEASQIVLQLQLNKQQVADTEINSSLDALLKQLPTSDTSNIYKPKTTFYKWALVASFSVLLISWFTLNFLKGGLVTYQTTYGELFLRLFRLTTS